MFALADCNNFFVSCERVFRPDLEHKAVVVLSNNDGCAISRSNEAKAMGVKMGQPFFEFRHLADSGRLTVFSSNFALYGDMSHRVQATLRSFVPRLEVYSIDESFMCTDCFDASTDFDGWAKGVSARCLRDTGIPVSVGVASTKTLAKIASKLCKQYPKLRGGCYMTRPEDVQKVLRKFPLEDVWGIGRRSFKRFAALGLKTAYDFASRNKAWVSAEMGITGVRTWRELNGEPCIEIDDNMQSRQQICVSRSFAEDISDIDALSGQLSLFVAMVAEKLRKQNSLCGAMQVFILSNHHRSGAPMCDDSRMCVFPTPSDSTLELNSAALSALRSMFRSGAAYKKTGVVLQNIIPKTNFQQSLFESAGRERHDRLMHTIDSLNRFDKSTVSLASQHHTIKMNRMHLSPEYTTSWGDIIKVHC